MKLFFCKKKKNEKKMKKKLFLFIKIFSCVILKIIKLIRLFCSLYSFDFINFDLYLLEENENKDIQSKKEYEEERLRNLFFVKLILSIALIGIFKLDTEQIGCVIVANLLSELIETFMYLNETNEINEANKDNETKK